MTELAAASMPNRFAQFYALTKPKVVQLIVFCALIGMVLAVPGLPSVAELSLMAIACVGTGWLPVLLQPSIASWSKASMRA